MRFYVASAAMIIAATMPIASSNGDSDCAACSKSIDVSMPINPTAAVVVDPATAAALNQQEGTTSDVQRAASEAVAASPNVCATLIDAAVSNDLPPAFLARLIWQESRFDPTSVSRAGARGIAQFMPQTASEVGLADPNDPFEALPASARLLQKLNREFGNLGLAAAAYNAGSGRIRDWLSKRQSLPLETRNYVRIITGYSAENWTEEQSVLELPTRLATGNPCTEISAADTAGAMPVKVSLTSEMTGLMRKARAEMLAAAARARKMAKNHKSRRGKDGVVAQHRGRKALAARSSRKSKLTSA
jgi:hypothetical protein